MEVVFPFSKMVELDLTLQLDVGQLGPAVRFGLLTQNKEQFSTVCSVVPHSVFTVVLPSTTPLGWSSSPQPMLSCLTLHLLDQTCTLCSTTWTMQQSRLKTLS
jgi:hypothetical protein